MKNRLIRVLGAVALLIASATVFAAPPKKTGALGWGASPEGYFMTAEERKQWESIVTQADAEKFIADFWARHGEAFHNEVRARIAAADKYFTIQNRKGSETEKGRVFMILGSPDRQQTIRGAADRGGFSTGPAGPNSIEQSALTTTEWQYQKKLNKELGVPELIVRFQTDVSRGFDTIENPGLVEPYLKRVVEYNMSRLASGQVPVVAAPSAVAGSGKAEPGVDPALWSQDNNLRGAFFTGEPFISPTEKTFYAYSFYLPKSVAELAEPKSIVMVGSIKDASGNQVATFRQPVSPMSYDAAGDRYADGSVELGPGKYSGVFAMYTADGAKLLANAKTDFEVPDIKTTRVSRPLLTARMDTLETQSALDPFTFVAVKYPVKGSGVFRKTDPVGFFTFIANPVANPNPSMMIRMKVSRDGKLIETTPLMPADLQQTGPHTYLLATRFEPNSLAPGHYSLQLTVRDMNAPKDSEAYTTGYMRTVEFDVTN